MNPVLRRLTERDKFSNGIENIAKHLTDNIDELLDTIIKNNISSVVSILDMQYHGYEILSPEDEYEYLRTTQQDINLAKSNFFLVRLDFSIKGEHFSRYLYLPYVSNYGLFKINDAEYVVNPVLTEYVISGDNKYAFVRLLRDKQIYMSKQIMINKNGKKIPTPIVISKLYKFDDSIQTKLPIALMLLIKYRFYELFNDVFKIDVKIFTKDDDIPDSIASKYDIYDSYDINNRINVNNYKNHGYRIAVERSKNNFIIESVVVSILYGMDITYLYSVGMKKHIEDENSEKMFWKILIGKFIFRNSYTIDRLTIAVNEFLDAVDNYIDDITRKKLREIGVVIDDYYDLVLYMLEKYYDITNNGVEKSINLETRYIDINYYLLYPIIEGINKTFYNINKKYRKDGLGSITIKSVNNIFNKHLNVKKILLLIREGVNIALTPVDATNSIMYYKVSGILEDQNRGAGVKREKNNAFHKTLQKLNSSDIILGNLLCFGKKAPTPRLKINTYIKIKDGNIILDKDDVRVMKKIDDMLKKNVILTDEDKEVYDNMDSMEANEE